MTALTRPVLYQNTYVWLVFVSALDVMLTWMILYLGGREVNGLAAWVIDRFGGVGMVVYKFALVALVIAICEAAGRRRDSAGRGLARFAVAVTCVPVLWSFFLLLA